MYTRLPRLIINFKNYENVLGESGLSLLSQIQTLVDKFDVVVGVAIVSLDLKEALKYQNDKLKIFAQHADPVGYGSNTGKISVEYLAKLGVYGVLVNHSEFRVGVHETGLMCEMLAEKKICSVLCAESTKEVRILGVFEPQVVAYEPPDLIGSDVSVVSDRASVQEVLGVIDLPIMVGAGIKDENDVAVALEMGCYGVLVASGIVKADDPLTALERFLQIIQKHV